MNSLNCFTQNFAVFAPNSSFVIWSNSKFEFQNFYFFLIIFLKFPPISTHLHHSRATFRSPFSAIKFLWNITQPLAALSFLFVILFFYNLRKKPTLIHLFSRPIWLFSAKFSWPNCVSSIVFYRRKCAFWKGMQQKQKIACKISIFNIKNIHTHHYIYTTNRIRHTGMMIIRII